MPKSAIVCCLLLMLTRVFAQAPPAETPSASAPVRPIDPRATPRGALFGFLEACHQGDYRRAASFLNLEHARNRLGDGQELARQFQTILDRNVRLDPSRLSAAPEGDLTDGLDPDFDLLGTVKTSGGRTWDLLLERVSRDGQQIWLISSGTAAMIPAVYTQMGETWADRKLPEWLRQTGPLDVAIWQWLGLLLLIAICSALAALLAQGVTLILRPVIRRTSTSADDELITSIRGPLRVLLGLALFQGGLEFLTPPILLRLLLARLIAALMYFAAAWLAVRAIDVVAAHLLNRMSGRQRASAGSILPLCRRTAKVTAVLVALLATLTNWGYDTTALLAGLGVGGLAVALAAQKTIENLIGGVALTTDRPVLVGDFCRYSNGKIGTVEDIGLRSTRIRTLDRTLVTIPNAQFSSMELENFGRRDKIFFNPTFRLRLDTTAAQLRDLVPAIRQILLDHPKVDPDPARVRFTGIGEHSMNIEIFSYVFTTDMNEFLLVQEQLLLDIMECIESFGAGLAAPQRLNVLMREPRRQSA